jgi:hypothetical protein
MRKPTAAAGSSLFFALAPGVVAGLVPWLLTGWETGDAWPPLQAIGAVLLVAGAAVLVDAFARFVVEGLGTPAPVAAPERLVVGATILGQALLLGRYGLLAYLAAFAVTVAAFVHFYEEPALTQRFGADYERYRREVPGWLPSLIARRAPPGPRGS